MFAHTLFHEHITRRKWLALAVNILGCSLTATGGHLSSAVISAAGIGCGLASGFCYSMTAVIGRLARDRTDAATMSVYSAVPAAVGGNTQGIARSQRAGARLERAVCAFADRHRLSAALPWRAEIRDSSRVPVLASVECVVAVGIALVLGSVLLMNSGTQKTACS